MNISLFNTLGRRKEELRPVHPGQVGIYTCGPTVYSRAHIGNLRAYVFADTLRRMLEYNGLAVKHVMNITDVGHLVSDADEGEDKMEKAAREHGKTPWEIAAEYTDIFFADCKKLNIKRPTVVAPATEYIQEMIEYVKCLVERGYVYETEDGLYFDISKYDEYGQLSGIDLEGQMAGARVEVNQAKRNPHDFAVWKKAPKEHIMQWESPWGMGYPGWHIECSVISTKHLGEVFDIHTGGVDHIPIHHENEIAQSVGCSGKIPANIWMHCEFLQIDKGKMSKSLGNVYTISDLEEKGYAPLALRYFYLNSHYRKQVNFTWEGIEGAHIALERLRGRVARLLEEYPEPNSNAPSSAKSASYEEDFLAAINDDLNVPKALAVVWDVTKDTSLGSDAVRLLQKFDNVLGLSLFSGQKEDSAPVELPADVMEKIKEREAARAAKDWAKADQIRDELLQRGIALIDTKDGTEWKLVR